MARQTAPLEELERLEQSITLTLQEIDRNFQTAERIVTTSILPIVEQYAKHSSDVWEGSKFWKGFFEASANVSLSGYEEAALEEDVSHTDTSAGLRTPTDDTPDEHADGGAHERDGDGDGDGDEDEDFTVDSPTQVTGMQTTPRLPASTATSTKTHSAGRRAPMTKPRAPFRSLSPRKYTGKNPVATEQSSQDPSTPRSHADHHSQSSPFGPESAFHPSARQQNRDALLHRVLDKNYRIQATPHTTQRKQRPPTTTTTTTKQSAGVWEDSPASSPALAAPQLRSDLFSPAKAPGAGAGAAAPAPRTPGISVLTPARRTAGRPIALPTTSTGRQLFSPQDKTYTSSIIKDRTSHILFDDDDDDDDEIMDMSPPKTMQFHVPQSRLMQTPAREASRRIVEDLLLTAGADATDDIEGIDEAGGMEEEPSPSVVRRAFAGEDDTF